jgi:hypothetical protein
MKKNTTTPTTSDTKRTLRKNRRCRVMLDIHHVHSVHQVHSVHELPLRYLCSPSSKRSFSEKTRRSQHAALQLHTKTQKSQLHSLPLQIATHQPLASTVQISKNRMLYCVTKPAELSDEDGNLAIEAAESSEVF